MLYKINKNYKHRTQSIYFDDTKNKDEWQKEVYIYAKEIAVRNNYKVICDFGTGSAYKLLDNFGDESKYETIGVDLKPTIDFLRKKYTSRKWESDINLLKSNYIDIFIASDVIEHMLDPDELLNIIKKLKPKDIILSTPDRNLSAKQFHLGPPRNKSHIREWSFEEFVEYIGESFDIISHTITNKNQRTQMIHAKIKS